jgi:putative NIF3 family GTP cyclohydrolase 1 type 2
MVLIEEIINMKLKDIYKHCIEVGIKNDPRGINEVKKVLAKRKKGYEKMDAEGKKDYDKELIENPYEDTRLLHGNDNQNIKRIMVGIDMEAAELLLADSLNKKGKKVDLVLAHHPEGRAFSGFYRVMKMQADIMNKFGVPINVAEDILSSRIDDIGRRVMPANHERSVDAARLLDIPFMCVHTPADNCVTGFLQKLVDNKKPDTVGEVVKILQDIPEYRDAKKFNFGLKILVGTSSARAGKIMVDMTGGTSGPKEAYEKLSQAGVGTIIGMHIPEDSYKEAKKHHINVIIAGHIASDNIGVNLILDSLMKKEKMEIIPVSGFRRVKRLKK